MKQIKIILFRGGFAGDLITALHNMNCFEDLTPTGKIQIKEELKLLQGIQQHMPIYEKDKYLNKHEIIACCDPEFALKHKDKTLMITCEDIEMSKYFCNRFFDYHHELLKDTTVKEYHDSFLLWKEFWSAKFKNKLDVSDIFTNNNFLAKLDTPIDDQKSTLFNDWKEINRKSFLDHKGTYDQ